MMTGWNGRSGSTPIESIRWDSSWPELASPDERRGLFGFLEERFGILEAVFDSYCLFRRKKSWFILHHSPGLFHASGLKVAKPGLKAFHRVGAFVKPTTRMIQIFGRFATKAKAEIDGPQLGSLLEGDEIILDQDQLTRGYVILTFKGADVLGLGFFKDGKVRNQISKRQLTDAMVQSVYP